MYNYNNDYGAHYNVAWLFYWYIFLEYKIPSCYKCTLKHCLVSHLSNSNVFKCHNELLKCDQVSWISLCVVKNDEHYWGSSVIDHRIIQNVGLLSCFCGRDPHSWLSNRVLPSENITEVHPLKPLGIWSWVGILGRITSIHSKIYTFSISSSYKWKGNSSSSCIFYSNSK